MEEMTVCASCGKQTFESNFCLFCGKKLVASKSDLGEPEGQEGPITQEIQTLEGQLKELLELKSKFDSDWKRLKSKINQEISSLESSMENSRKELNELDFLHSVEEVDPKEYKNRSEAIAKSIEDSQKIAKARRDDNERIEGLYKELTNSVYSPPKKKRKIKPNKVGNKLAKLKEAYDAKTISPSLYEKLKTKYEEELKSARS